MTRTRTTLSELARLGFAELGEAQTGLAELDPAVGADELLPYFAGTADPDLALRQLARLDERHPAQLRPVVAAAPSRLLRLLGASAGLVDFLDRRPEHLAGLVHPLAGPPPTAELRRILLASVGADAEAAVPVAELAGEDGRVALRVRYRAELVRLAAWDLEQPDGAAVLDRVAAALADLAAASLEASLAVARRTLGVGTVAEELPLTRLAIIGMGKAGARELNVISDVDVIFVGGSLDEQTLSSSRGVELATRLAMETMRGIQELSVEPALWEVDANLRPEGKSGALVRSLDSHVAYYDRWASSWEFQALLKARPMAGDAALGADYLAAIAPKVWASATRDGFVESVQRMRERVTANIPADEVDVQLKLGPGGLRDVEFTIQLLQLVHGRTDESVRHGGTIPALRALEAGGYIGRAEAEEFERDYRELRLLEHRIQLRDVRRTHLMPRDPDALRVLARATGLATGSAELLRHWEGVRIAVRGLHEKLFYRPLLAAVAALPEDGVRLSSDQAEARLAAIGFADPRGALGHIAAMTAGVSRRASIQRALLPIMLQWFSDGADPDQGLLAFRRLSDDLGDAHWYLRMLRDSTAAAARLTRVLSGSRFVVNLVERIPEAAAWLEDDDELRPRTLHGLREEVGAVVARHESVDAAAAAIRALRRREVLRLALGGILGLIRIEDLGRGLADITTATIRGALALARRGDELPLEFAVIAMGRYGGAELGFGSDADIVYVYRTSGELDTQTAQRRAERIVAELNRLTEDVRLPLDLDAGLRPEGRNGSIVRSLESYRGYYARWSQTWEAQALLRASGVAGDASLIDDFALLAETLRYPAALPAEAEREIKRIKARVEAERLPRGADPSRHLKLGRGSLSDVEWLVQLLQLRHAGAVPGLRTTSTLEALDAAVAAELLDAEDAARLREAWLLASRVRSAMTLWTAKTADVLPSDRRSLEGIARLMEFPPGCASQLEELYLAVTRRARAVFDRLFYGLDEQPRPTAR